MCHPSETGLPGPKQLLVLLAGRKIDVFFVRQPELFCACLGQVRDVRFDQGHRREADLGAVSSDDDPFIAIPAHDVGEHLLGAH